MKLALRLLALLSLGMISACASTSMTAFKDPEFKGASYSNLLVHVVSEDLALRRQIEQRAVEELASGKVTAVAAAELFFPGKEYSGDQLIAALDKQGVEAVLVIRRQGSGSSSHYVPPTYHTTSSASGTSVTNSYASGSATRTGNTVSGSAYGTSATTAVARGKSTTTVSGGYNVSKPWARFRVELVDVATGSVIWTAQGDSSGNGYNDQEDLWQSVADESVDQLREAGLVSTPQ